MSLLCTYIVCQRRENNLPCRAVGEERRGGQELGEGVDGATDGVRHGAEDALQVGGGGAPRGGGGGGDGGRGRGVGSQGVLKDGGHQLNGQGGGL